MKDRRRPAAAVVLTPMAALAVGCARPPPATVQELRARAAFDLGCPPGWIRIYELGRFTRGVAGCGRRLTYVESCGEVHDGRACTWRRDGSGAAAAGTAARLLPATVSTVPRDGVFAEPGF